MSAELGVQYTTAAATVYFLMRGPVNTVVLISSGALTAYVSANLALYKVAGTRQDTSGYFTGDVPTNTPAGVYGVLAFAQVGGSPAESDPCIGWQPAFQWSGTAQVPLSSLATPTNITAGTMTTVTNLTNAPTVGDFTSTMKTSLNAATPSLSAAGVGAIVTGMFTTADTVETGWTLQSFCRVVGASIGSVTGAPNAPVFYGLTGTPGRLIVSAQESGNRTVTFNVG